MALFMLRTCSCRVGPSIWPGGPTADAEAWAQRPGCDRGRPGRDLHGPCSGAVPRIAAVPPRAATHRSPCSRSTTSRSSIPCSRPPVSNRGPGRLGRNLAMDRSRLAVIASPDGVDERPAPRRPSASPWRMTCGSCINRIIGRSGCRASTTCSGRPHRAANALVSNASLARGRNRLQADRRGRRRGAGFERVPPARRPTPGPEA
jgi:hypothetical protein